MAALALWRPDALAGLNRLWLRFGLLLHRIVSPVVMAFLFYVTNLLALVLVRTFAPCNAVTALPRKPLTRSYR